MLPCNAAIPQPVRAVHARDKAVLGLGQTELRRGGSRPARRRVALRWSRCVKAQHVPGRHRPCDSLRHVFSASAATYPANLRCTSTIAESAGWTSSENAQSEQLAATQLDTTVRFSKFGE